MLFSLAYPSLISLPSGQSKRPLLGMLNTYCAVSENVTPV